MTSLFTTLRWRGLFLLGGLAIACTATSWIFRPPAPRARATPPVASPTSGASAAASAPSGSRASAAASAPSGKELDVNPDTITGTITEVHMSLSCGVFVGVAQVRYGDRFGLMVPCVEFLQGTGLRFAVGDSHRLFVGGDHRVHAIEWRGQRYRSAATRP